MGKKQLDNLYDDDFDLSILPVKTDNQSINIRRPFHPMLPDISKGALTMLLASVRSGKSVCACNLLCNSNFYRDCFDAVYVFSSTINQDSTGRKIKEMFPNTCYDTFDENRLQKIIDYQAQQDPDERESIAIILDDLPNYLKPKSLFFTLSSNYRHFGIGLLLYSQQAYKQVSPIVRSNLTNFIIGTINQSQLDLVAKDFGEQFAGIENFKKYYRLAVPERFNFLYGRLDQYPAILHKAFDEKILYQDDY